MSGIEQIPANSRIKAYDYCNATWRNIAVQRSGEVIIARGEHIIQGLVIATAASGGTALGSGRMNSGLGNIDRVIVKCPVTWCSGTARKGLVENSGLVQGIFIGGASGSPYMPWINSGAACVNSGQGYWLHPGEQKELYVQDLSEVRVVGWPSGYPTHWIAETIVC